MRILNAIIVSKPPRAMKMPKFQLIKCCTVGCQPIRYDGFRLDRLVTQKTSEQLQRCLSIPPTLDDNVQNLAFVVNRAP